MEEDQIDPGDEVSWISEETGNRNFGTVLSVRPTYLIVGDGWRGVKAVQRRYITKECG